MMIQIKCGTVKMEGRIDIICNECGALVMSVAELLAATQKISLREATETLITAIYKSIPEWEKENRP